VLIRVYIKKNKESFLYKIKSNVTISDKKGYARLNPL